MNGIIALSFGLVVGLVPYSAHSAIGKNEGFDVVAFGGGGGIDDSNLTSYFISPSNDEKGVMCDAGTLIGGIKQAKKRGNFANLATSDVIQNQIQGYLITHAHLDHVAGLVILSPDDNKKPIYALPSTLEVLSDHYFNWQSWPNFANSGTAPKLNKYDYVSLVSRTKVSLKNTQMSATAFELSHDKVSSTAFLIEYNGSAILCMGDTGSDSNEGSNHLETLWLAVSEYVKRGELKAIIIESSYPNSRPERLLFGHLTPKLVQQELSRLAQLSGGKDALAGLSVIISHIKYSMDNDQTARQQIADEFKENQLNIEFLFPEQGEKLVYP